MAVRSQLRDLAASVLSRPRRTGGEIRISTATRDRIVGRLTLGTSGLEFDSSVIWDWSTQGLNPVIGQSSANKYVEADETAITVRLAGGAVVSRATPAQIEPFTATPASVQRQPRDWPQPGVPRSRDQPPRRREPRAYGERGPRAEEGPRVSRRIGSKAIGAPLMRSSANGSSPCCRSSRTPWA